jgi:two-component sensor histidine kinase/CheY-like chemotaxis protein
MEILRRMKVVIVDDSAADRKLCRFLLEEAHGSNLALWEEDVADKGLETCRAVSPDCVLLDYMLPDMTGLEFLTRLRADELADSPVAAVVMLTGLASEQVAVDAMKAGAQDYLVKDRITAEGLSSAIEKATHKVALLRALKRERDQLARSLAEKEILLKEVHHRVKNNLQVIASLLRLQAKSSGNEVVFRALQESQGRIESMALIHEQLYARENLGEVDLAEHAAIVSASLFSSYGVDPGQISRRVLMEPTPVGVDRAIPAGLILNELISNALKYGFPDGRQGSIWIEGGRQDGLVTLTVRDDGIGVPEETELRRPKSFGLEIVEVLTRQLKGKFEFDRSHGTAFRIVFPESAADRPGPSLNVTNAAAAAKVGRVDL